MGMLDSNLMNALRNQRIALLILSLSLICFLLIAFLRSSFSAVDANVNSWAASIQSTSYTQIAKIIHYGFGIFVLSPITLLIAGYLLYKRYRNYALLLVGTMLGDVVIVEILKRLIHSSRPLNGIIQETGFSFPSGHATAAVVLAGLLTYFIWQHFKSRNVKILSGVLLILISLVVGFSRIYLNVHWLSDVVGAYSLGIFWLTFSIVAFRLQNAK
jgi:undecaprenyl-diphosphatase